MNDEVGRLKDQNSQPVEKYCWIKADPTFGGLKQIINEPEGRVHIGRLPPKLAEVNANTTRFIDSLTIRRKSGTDPDHQWFDVNVPLNVDMVAIIGNKGSGKSALADILALAGNTHCDTGHFSFLTKDRFCERNGRIAKDFEVRLNWMDGSNQTRSLFDKPDSNEVERVKYIPQAYLETVCTETAPGEESDFQTELRKVIFSHITDADRLGQESLDDLIGYKTEEIRAQLQVHRQEISRLNGELVRLEARATPEYGAQLASQRALRQKELEAHVAAKPVLVEQPGNLSADEQVAVKNVADALKGERDTLTSIEGQVEMQAAHQKRLTEQIAVAKKLEGKLANFEAEYERLVNDTRVDVTALGLTMESMVTFTVNPKPVTDLRETLTALKVSVDASLDTNLAASLPQQIAACKARIKALQERLDAILIESNVGCDRRQVLGWRD
jgi:energy-coupling factor transporter ATP-binding protein EcfA2